MTDPEYIKMILALPSSVFDGWEWQAGDKFILREDRKHKIHYIGDSVLYNGRPYDLEVTTDDIADNLFDAVPLPSQEQLLHIYVSKTAFQSDSLALLMLANWLEDKVKDDHSFCLKYKTSEEIALLFVMEKCYGKMWDGEAWI